MKQENEQENNEIIPPAAKVAQKQRYKYLVPVLNKIGNMLKNIARPKLTIKFRDDDNDDMSDEPNIDTYFPLWLYSSISKNLEKQGYIVSPIKQNGTENDYYAIVYWEL
jgi:hypothetical protein